MIENNENRKVWLLNDLPETAFTSSNSLNASTQGHHSKLRSSDVTAVGWFAGSTTVEWIQADLGHPKTLREIHVAPPSISNLIYVKKFKVLCSLDGTKMLELGDFEGFAEPRQYLVQPSYCRHVRIAPTEFQNAVALRWEVVQATGNIWNGESLDRLNALL